MYQPSSKILSAATALVVAGSMIVSHASPARAQDDGATAPDNAVTAEAPILESEQQTEELLTVIDQIPEEVLLEGDEATQAWVAANLQPAEGGDDQNVPGEADDGQATVQGDFLKCSGAILFLIGSTAIPAAKLLKIKRYMNALGGTTEAIKILWGASFSHEKLKALGGVAAALGAELLGIAAVRDACF